MRTPLFKASLCWSILCMIFILTSCADDENMYLTEDIQPQRIETRSSNNDIASNGSSLTEKAAIAYANQRLQRPDKGIDNVSIDYVIASEEETKRIASSDTIAYLINYSNGEGFAVIINDSRVEPVVAMSKTGNISLKNGKINDPFLKNLESYLVTKVTSATNTRKRPDGMYNFVCTQQFIETEVHERAPYNSVVAKTHPNCVAGSVPTCAAILLSYTFDTFTYKNVEYNFKNINKCLIEGPGYEPLYPDIQPLSSFDFPISFKYGYSGAVSAMSTLINDLGKDLHTVYSTTNSTTNDINAYNLFKSLGCTVSEYNYTYKLNRIIELALNDYVLLITGVDNHNSEKTSFIMEGLEINDFISYNEYSLVYLWLYSVVDKYGEFYSGKTGYYADYLEYNKEFTLTSFFGIKHKFE